MSDFNTSTFQVLLVNTTLAEFTAPAETAVMNAVHNYLVAEGYSNFYMGLGNVSEAILVSPCCA